MKAILVLLLVALGLFVSAHIGELRQPCQSADSTYCTDESSTRITPSIIIYWN